MPLNLEEILALPDIGQKINYLKKGRKTELPDRCKLWDDWNPERHEIMVDEKKYPDRKVLEEKGMSQKQLAGEIGISPSRVNDYISGRSEPTLKIARLLCRVLNIPPAAMLGF